MTKKEFVSLLGEQARADMAKTGILASLTTAQGILESGYGTRELAVNANNIFGMKAELSGNKLAVRLGRPDLHKGNERTEAERRSLHNNGSVPKI